MIFYLGTHEVQWLGKTDVPLFISRRRLADRRTLPRARGVWALDSGGFTEIDKFGGWQTPPAQYVAEVRRFQEEIGGMHWAAIQDWMCEPHMLAKTGLTVEEHQARTVQSYLDLMNLAWDLPWLPVLQGWTLGDYLLHIEQYERAGINLVGMPVGLGTVCRRQGTLMPTMLINLLAREGLKIHAFGFKMRGLQSAHHNLASADSMAWSYDARHKPPLPGHTHGNCANCLEYALEWRDCLLESLPTYQQGLLEGVA